LPGGSSGLKRLGAPTETFKNTRGKALKKKERGKKTGRKNKEKGTREKKGVGEWWIHNLGDSR